MAKKVKSDGVSKVQAVVDFLNKGPENELLTTQEIVKAICENSGVEVKAHDVHNARMKIKRKSSRKKGVKKTQKTAPKAPPKVADQAKDIRVDLSVVEQLRRLVDTVGGKATLSRIVEAVC